MYRNRYLKGGQVQLDANKDGTITAEDDVLDNADFYEGMLQSYFIWSNGDGFDRDPDPSIYTNYDYVYMNGPLGFTWGINWASW